MKKMLVFALLPLVSLSFSSCSDCSVQPDARAASQTEEGAASSQPLDIAAMIGSQLVNAKNEVVDAGVLKDRKLGLYFSAHWCPPCRAFSPTLVEIYNEWKQADKPFEIVLVSLDRSEADMLEYMKDAAMPWPALSFDSQKKKELSERFSVRGIPTLVILGQDGKLLTDKGRDDIMRLGANAFDEWK